MRIAIQGCLHGELDIVYQVLHKIQQKQNTKIDLLIICGDFQAARNETDLAAMSIKDKYRSMGSFWKYYSGKAIAPFPTLFIGGNHEASNYLYELYHGGWVARNIYFMGFANVIRFGPLRIAGLSGIYNAKDYNLGFYESQPFNNFDKISIYHVRKFNVYRLAQVKTPLDICLSHDWPRGIAHHGNRKRLISLKKFLEQEINRNVLGSYPAEFLLHRLKPAYWFSAHLHVKFAAIFKHSSTQNNQLQADGAPVVVSNPDEIQLNDDLDEDLHLLEGTKTDDGNILPTASIHVSTKNASSSATPQKSNGASIHQGRLVGKEFPGKTKFLSLDKVMPSKNFLQIMDIDTDEMDGPYEFSYDPEWLAIVRASNPFFSATRQQTNLPRDEMIASEIQTALEWVRQHISDLRVPSNFVQTASTYNSNNPINMDYHYYQSEPFANPQTVEYCRMLDIVNHINPGGRYPHQVDTVPVISIPATPTNVELIDHDSYRSDNSPDQQDSPPRHLSSMTTGSDSNSTSRRQITDAYLAQEAYHEEPMQTNTGIMQSMYNTVNNDIRNADVDMEDDEDEPGLLADELDLNHRTDLGAQLDMGFGIGIGGEAEYGDEGDPALDESTRHSSVE